MAKETDWRERYLQQTEKHEAEAKRYEEAEAELTEDQLKFIEDHGSGVLSDEFYTWLVKESAKTLRNAIDKAQAH